MTVTIQAGNIFEQKAHWVVGFSDTFDTDTRNNVIINRESLQGQLLAVEYGGDVERLDQEVAAALRTVQPSRAETRESKPQGKLVRYPLGTVAVLGSPQRHIFAVAYSRMGNDLVARSTVEDLWVSLGRLWDAVFLHCQRAPIAVPLMGTQLARIDCLDRNSLLKMLLLSFVARSREQLVSRELRVLVHPHDHEKINTLDLQAFLNAL